MLKELDRAVNQPLTSHPMTHMEDAAENARSLDEARPPHRCLLVEDRDVPDQYRVEAFDTEGALELAVFSGPNARDRALAFAGGDYYDEWEDPQAIGGY